MQTRFSIATDGPGLYEFTGQVADWVRGTGVLTLFVQHTSCSLLIQENADPAVRRDLLAYFDRLVPPADDPAMGYLTMSTKAPTTCPRISRRLCCRSACRCRCVTAAWRWAHGRVYIFSSIAAVRTNARWPRRWSPTVDQRFPFSGRCHLLMRKTTLLNFIFAILAAVTESS
jgi:hypothetical protein